MVEKNITLDWFPIGTGPYKVELVDARLEANRRAA